MRRLIEALPFRTLLTTLSGLPLVAAIAFGAVMSWNAFQVYEDLRNAVMLEKLATAAGSVLLSTSKEGAASSQDLPMARVQLDEAYQVFLSTYSVYRERYNDKAMDGYETKLRDGYGAIGDYRAAVDGGSTDPMVPLKFLSPISVNAIEISGRARSLVTDHDLAAMIEGYYALMRVNIGYLMVNRFGQLYSKTEALGLPEHTKLVRTLAEIDVFTKSMREFLPPSVLNDYNRFGDTSDGKLIAKTIGDMTANLTHQPMDEDYQNWGRAMAARRALASSLMEKTATVLTSTAATKIETARTSLITFLTSMFLLIAGVLTVSVSTRRVLSQAIRLISDRMEALAKGDRTTAIPFTKRRDEIGGMATSVEVFRKASIRNAELEEEAEEARRTAERERVHVQELAEREAEARLNAATASLKSALHRLAGGDMHCEISEEFAPQFETLRRDFNLSVSQLRSVLVSVGRTTNAVNDGSREISHATDDLARRTEQQAASLEQTAAALEEITANVKAASERTGEVRNLVRDTRGRADQAGIVVENAVAAMRQIEHASHQISQIIGVIDEIAFQTNLLALNAGVEAARAGEAGKGFAVVAQEVRELAQRSANAAKEIKGLIGNSAAAVSEGVRLVDDTGQGLKAIADLVQSAHQHMDAIASAAQEQSIGIGEVNSAVNHMDQATQQNAAMVEEMNAASAALAGEAARLAQLLEQFQTAPNKDVSQGGPISTRLHPSEQGGQRLRSVLSA